MKTDIEIAQSTEMLPVGQVAEKAGIDENLLEYYGKVKAKIDIRPQKSQADPGHCHQPHSRRRGQDHHQRRSGRRHGETEQKYHALSP